SRWTGKSVARANNPRRRKWLPSTASRSSRSPAWMTCWTMPANNRSWPPSMPACWPTMPATEFSAESEPPDRLKRTRSHRRHIPLGSLMDAAILLSDKGEFMRKSLLILAALALGASVAASAQNTGSIRYKWYDGQGRRGASRQTACRAGSGQRRSADAERLPGRGVVQDLAATDTGHHRPADP